MTQLDSYGYGGFIVLKKGNNQPLQEALALWQGQEACEKYNDPHSKEHIQFWDADDIDTLDTYQGSVRVIRAVLTKPDQAPTTWCFAILGPRARKVGRRTALKISCTLALGGYGLQPVDPVLELRTRVSAYRECTDGSPVALDPRLQSASAVRLSAAETPPAAQRSHRHHPTHRRGHAPRCSHFARAHPLGGPAAGHQLTRRRSRAHLGGAGAPDLNPARIFPARRRSTRSNLTARPN